jgi:hypothetical protein
LVVPLRDAGKLEKDSTGWSPEELDELGSQVWEAVGLTLKTGDMVAWPVVLGKRPIG